MTAKTDARNSIAAFLKNARLKAKLEPAEAARHLDLESTEFLLRVESGVTSISLAQLYSFANIYNIAPEEILGLVLELTSIPLEQLDDSFQLAAGGDS